MLTARLLEALCVNGLLRRLVLNVRVERTRVLRINALAGLVSPISDLLYEAVCLILTLYDAGRCV